MSNRTIIQELTWRRNSDGELITRQYYFKTEENAILNAIKWKRTAEAGTSRTVVSAKVINKITGATVWEI